MLFAIGLTDVAAPEAGAARQGGPAVRIAAASAGKDAGSGKADKDDDDDDDEDDNKYPQAVRAGDLIGRSVIAPLESQNLLGHVMKLVRNGDGDVTVVMTYGGYLGFGTHLVCVPLDDVALTGYALQAKEISATELDRLPVCDGGQDAPLDPKVTVKVNLARPSH